MNWAKVALFAGGALFGSAGIEILTSKDAKKLYTQCTAAVLRMKDSVMETATTLQENCGDILADAKESWITACLADGVPVPEPVRLEDYSGQFKLRLPKSLHRALSLRSSEEGVSMNQLCLYLLSKGLQA